MLNSVVKISVMPAKYFEYYTIMLTGYGGRFFHGHAVVTYLMISVLCD